MFDVRQLFAALLGRPGPQNAFQRGVAALALDESERAVAEFDVALAAAGDDAERAVRSNKRGVALVHAGDRTAALAAFASALRWNQRYAPALTNLGNMLFEDGDVADAIDYYEAAIRADDTYALAYRNFGVALKRLGRRSAAVRALRKASRLESRRPSEPP